MDMYRRKVKASKAGCGTNSQTCAFARLPKYSLTGALSYLSLLAIGRANSTSSPIVTRLQPV